MALSVFSVLDIRLDSQEFEPWPEAFCHVL